MDHGENFNMLRAWSKEGDYILENLGFAVEIITVVLSD